MTWTLMIHGGSGRLTRETIDAATDAAARAALGRALDAGGAILAGGGSALDAVEAAVRVLEDDPVFNAGRGAAFGRDGTITLDAAIMDGATRAAGAVAEVRRTRSPVSLARRVLNDGRHILIAGEGADAFAAELAVEQVDPDWFATPERRRQLSELQAKGGDAFDVDMKYGTVGAVARDAAGRLAAATSTGGVTGKRAGRIGDSPLVGAGTWADDRGCAVSATGSGEHFIRANAAAEISARVRLLGETVAVAAAAVLTDVTALGGTGGVIVSDAVGNAAWHFTTAGMYRAMMSADGKRQVAIYGDE